MNEKQMKTIFSMKMAAFLMTKGFVLVDMAKNTDGSGKNVFFFNDSDELRLAMEEYKQSGYSQKG